MNRCSRPRRVVTVVLRELMISVNWLVVACSLLSCACGAKTGLRVPTADVDAGANDAGHDGGLPPIPAWSCLGEELIAVELPSLALPGPDSWTIAVTNPHSSSVDVVLESVDASGLPHMVDEATIAAGGMAEFHLAREVARRASVECTRREDCESEEACLCTPVDCSCGAHVSISNTVRFGSEARARFSPCR